MPSTSDKQRRFMAAVAHNPQFAAKVGVPVSVGEEFNAADEALANPNKKKPKLTIGRQTYEGK
jgi:hypothetical protein